MKYTFQMKKYNDMEYLSIYTKNDESIGNFFTEFLIVDAYPFNKLLLAMINDVKKE